MSSPAATCFPSNASQLFELGNKAGAGHANNSTSPFPQRNAGAMLLGFASIMSLWFGQNDIFSAGTFHPNK